MGGVLRFIFILASITILSPHPGWAKDRANASRPDEEFLTEPFDGIRWQYPVQKRVVSVGDIHGDLDALVAILKSRDLIDASGHWTGGTTHLVLLGDLVDGFFESKLVMDFCIRLEGEASAAGGRVHSLLGNHDLMTAEGSTVHMTKDEKKTYVETNGKTPSRSEIHEQLGPATKYGEWIRERNSIVQIGQTLYVHGGVDEWLLDPQVEPGNINSTVRAWIRYWQKLGPRPPKHTEWTVGYHRKKGFITERGPLFHRGFKIDKSGKGKLDETRNQEGPRKKALKKIMKSLAIDHIVVGHAPTPDEKIHLSHPYYGDRVKNIDTHIAREFGGKLSALEEVDGEFNAYYTERPKKSDDLKFNPRKENRASVPVPLKDECMEVFSLEVTP